MPYTNIDDPSAHFQVKLWTGNATAGNTITLDGNSDMQPDFVWSKRRDVGFSHVLKDTSRGGTSNNDLHLVSNLSNAESTYTNYRMDFNSDGFTLDGVGDSGFQGSGTSMVSWAWKANGGTTSSNTDGTITSTVQANQDAGFSIVTYTGTGVYNQTVGHGLGIAPAVVILKNRTTGEASYDDWWVYHKGTSVPVNRGLRLNEDAAEVSTTVLWSVVPSSTIFGVGGSVDAPRYTNGASQNYVAYCFAEKQGYSKFGKYVGNGSANGTFIYTGFKPAFVLVKNYSNSGYNWRLVDSARNTFNLTDLLLMPDLDSAEFDGSTHASNIGIDFLSNGFKCRSGQGAFNLNGGSYIYMAFAENPFTTSTGVPTTAR